MMVARQFIAWDVSKKATRPIGTVRAALSDVSTLKVEEDSCRPNHTVP
jgi:hypothetical protein